MVWDLENFSKKIFFRNFFFAQKVPKWSNSKIYHKSEIWRPSNFFYYQVNLAWHLENFSKSFRFFLLKKFLNGPIRKVIMLKVGFEDLQNFSPLPGHPGSTLRKLLQKVSKWFNLQSYVRIDTWRVKTFQKFFISFNLFLFRSSSISNSMQIISQVILGGPRKFTCFASS